MTLLSIQPRGCICEFIRADDGNKFDYILSPEKRPNSRTGSPKNKIDSPLKKKYQSICQIPQVQEVTENN